MKDFDLEAAKRGATVCTREGKPAKFDGIIEGYGGNTYVKADVVAPMTFFNDGRNFRSTECGLDLMMADDDYLEKLERGEYQSGQIRPLYENPSNSMPLNLTKREWFAGMAMAGEISGCLAAGNGFDGDKSIPGIIVKSSVMIADAMIEELEKTEK